MDGIYLIVLIGFAALSAALLGLCIVLAPQSSAGTGHTGSPDQALAKHCAADRRL
ncbi:hypothetical protein [Cupriavidus necator]|uniref:hypothetical protein n=1 Tax=Cupriavidus necator TaxID=106590 RepID=UPI00339D3EC3